MRIYNYNNAKLIKEFSKNKTIELYTKILDTNSEYADRCKCKTCGKDIFYSNVQIGGIYSDKLYIKSGTSHCTTKKINNIEYSLHVCEECMKKKFKELEYKNINRIYNMPNIYSQYAFDIPEDAIYSKKMELCVRNEESFIKKYGEDVGKQRWNAYLEKQRETNTYLYKHEKYGMSLDEFVAYNKSRSCTYNNFIRRYGDIEGKKKWDEYRYREAYTNSLEYYMNKYGDADGLLRWNKLNKSKATGGCSKISQELFHILKQDPIFYMHELYYRDLNREYEVNDTINKRIYYLDFYDATLNLCIEFNGLKFHPKPGKYAENDMFKNPFMKSEVMTKDMWDKEATRISYLEKELGMHVIVVWEDDYVNNKENEIRLIKSKILEIYGN